MKNLKKKILSLILILAMVMTMLPINSGMKTAEAADTTGSISLDFRYGTNNLIQMNTNLPSDTPCVNFTTDDNGCNIDQSGNTVQWVGWIGMDNVDGTIVLTFNFNNAFTAGQTYVLPKGAVFGFMDGKTYTLDGDYTFTFDGSSWTKDVSNQDVIPEEPEEEIPEELTFEYRYGANNVIQVNTNLPASTPCVNFTAGDNGCNIDQSGNEYQQVGWIGMDNVDGTIVLTFHFNNAFTAGQTYVLPKGSIFGFTDGNAYPLDKYYTFTFDGNTWSMTAETEQAPEEEEIGKLTLAYRYGANNLIQVNTDLPATTALKDFLATDNGCELIQGGSQVFGYASMVNVSGTIVITFNFNGAFTSGQNYILGKGSIFGFSDGTKYELDRTYIFTYDGSTWNLEIPEALEQFSLSHRYGTSTLIQVNTSLPVTTTCANFLAADNGCEILQSGNQVFGWAGMSSVDGTIVITFNFNNAFTSGQTYVLSQGSVFGFTDGTKYELDETYKFTYDGSNWSLLIIGDTNSDNEVSSVDLIRMKKAEATTYSLTDYYDIVPDSYIDHWDLNRVRDIILDQDAWKDSILETTDYLLDPLRFDGGEEFVSFADIPVDATNPEKIEEFKALGFNTSLLTEDHAKSKYSVTVEKSETAEIELKDGEQLLELSYTGYTTGSMIQILTNLPGDKTYSGFLIGENGHELNVQSDKTVGYFQLWKDGGSNKVYFNPIYNNVCDNGDRYILKAGSKLNVDGVYYVLDRTYTFTIKNNYLASIQNLDKAGLNIWIRNNSNQKDYFTDDLTKQLALHKDKIDGFYVTDEPFMTQELYNYSKEKYNASEVTEGFENISSTLVPWFNSNYANTYFHVNHVPMSSYNHYGEKGDTSANASKYLQLFNTYASNILNNVDTSDEKKTLGYDMYPLGYSQTKGFWLWQTTEIVEKGIDPDYLVNMLIPAKAAKDNNATFSVCIQTYDKINKDNSNNKREITTAAEVSFQLYSAMACGADMFEFFTYNSLEDTANNTTYNGIIDLSGNKTELYDGVKTANTNAFAFSNVVNAFDWQGVQVSSGSTSKNATGITTAKNSGLSLLLDDSSNGVLSSVTSDDDALVGYYAKGSQAGYMVANYNDPKQVTTNNTVTLTFAGCTKARVYTSKAGELTSEVVELSNGSYTCEVEPGEGFFVIPVDAE